MPRKRAFRALDGIDPERLAEFQAGIRRRYGDEELLDEDRACAERLGRSPTMREFADDPQTRVHPQTVIEHFGSWNAAKREAGLVPRRFATREELLQVLRDLGEELGRTPTARDLEERRGRLPSKSLYWHTFGSLTTALREAGYDIPVGEERLERAVEQGVRLARKLKRLPKFADWAEARKADDTILTEWQVYRMFDSRRGCLGDVPVPDLGAPARAGRAGQRRRSGRLGGLDERGEAPEAMRALVRSADRRQHVVLDERAVRAKAFGPGDPAVGKHDHRALGHLTLLEPDVGVALDGLEREEGGGEEDLSLAAASRRGRPTPRARKRRPGRRSSIQAVAIAP